MKLKYSIMISLVFVAFVYSQNARDFYPSTPDYKWYFTVTPHDTNNQPNHSLAYARIDSFSSEGVYKDMTACFMPTKSGSDFSTLEFLPYYDTLFYSFNGSWAYQYLDGNSIMDGEELSDSSFADLLNSIEGWYSVFNFAAVKNVEHLIFTKDTTINFDGTNYPLRFEVFTIRREKEILNTKIGDFNCEKFTLLLRVKYKVILFYVTILEIPRDNWIANGQWILKTYRPTTTLDLTDYGGGKYVILGSTRMIDDGIETNIKNEDISASDFLLFQNYPNPFNPTTIIRYSILSPLFQRGDRGGFVTLKIYNILGHEIATLVNEEKPPGIYEVYFDGSQLSSGVYFCHLKINDKIRVNKMLLLR